MKKSETSVLLTKKQLTYLLIALKSYEDIVNFRWQNDFDVGDAHVDLLVIDSIRILLKKSHAELE